eukprot:gb/GECH01011693.1/.p1 GENE.gb/GECH01011693.1/~~gb/GECH01011693.1/.p1  ORF type:complete len:520 (+),score=90.84 gb/GECH01011693.1/:1-1560(+)
MLRARSFVPRSQGRRVFSTVTAENSAAKANQPSVKDVKRLFDYDSSSKEIFRNHTTASLIKSRMYLKMSQLPTIAKTGTKFITGTQKIPLVSDAVNSVVRNTMFRHFCGGEDVNEARTIIHRLQAQGIGAILDYSVEAESGEESDPAKAFDAAKDHIITSINLTRDVHESLPAVNPPNPSSSLGFSCVKLSGIGDPQVLLRLSKILTAKASASTEQAARFLPVLDHINWAKRDRMELVRSMQSFIERRTPPFPGDEKSPVAGDPLTEDEMHKFASLCERLDAIYQVAAESGVSVLIDAEQTYYQPAIDFLALLLSVEHNSVKGRARPIVYNTYQLYLKDALERMKYDSEFALDHGFSLGTKLVRGAYSQFERDRSKQLGLKDPIHNTIEDTHIHYDDAVRYCIPRCHDGVGMGTVIATHNPNSVQIACQDMASHDIIPSSPRVVFAQLLGMGDAITSSVSAGGFNGAKYVPYGPLQKVLPYLTRRMEENKDIMGTSSRDINVIDRELNRRLNERTGLQL